MRLFIANTTKQYVDFTYRLPEEKNTRMDRISPGSQSIIGGDLAEDMVHWIIAQHVQVSGLKSVAEVKNLKSHTGLVYNIDKPVPLDNIIEVIETNDEILDETAELLREETAAAIAAHTQDRVKDAGVRVARTEVEMTEDTPGEPGINNAFEITAEGVTPRHGTRRSSRQEGNRWG